ncbi:hypothetical protein BCR32DRAFT_181544, partial [Anaeromyces robustus]
NEYIVKHLINHGASIDGKRREYYYTPLHVACNCGNEIMVKYLIEAGVDINKIRGNYDYTLL